MPGDVTIRSHADTFNARIRRILSLRVSACATLIRDEVVRVVTEGRTRSDGPSLPGNPPHIDTGRLRNSIFAGELSELEWQVGSNLNYALWLEEGTSGMAARPYLRVTFERLLPKCRRIIGKEIK